MMIKGIRINQEEQEMTRRTNIAPKASTARKLKGAFGKTLHSLHEWRHSRSADQRELKKCTEQQRIWSKNSKPTREQFRSCTSLCISTVQRTRNRGAWK